MLIVLFFSNACLYFVNRRCVGMFALSRATKLCSSEDDGDNSILVVT